MITENTSDENNNFPGMVMVCINSHVQSSKHKPVSATTSNCKHILHEASSLSVLGILHSVYTNLDKGEEKPPLMEYQKTM